MRTPSTRRSLRASALLACALMLMIAIAHATDIPWDLDALKKAPRTWPAPELAKPGVEAFFYEGLPFRGKPTRVFAFYGAPALAPGEKAPAMVLVHGGGGTAFEEWVRLWNERGYAAIAMDLGGRVRGEGWAEDTRAHAHEWAGPPQGGGLGQMDWPPEDRWPYHAVAAILLAHSHLRTCPEVDIDRVGITGISWGGFLTSLVAGLDDRLRLAVPVYGCGFIHENSHWLDAFERLGEAKAGEYARLYDPSNYLPRAKLPMLWVTGTNDFAYPLDSLRKSYRATPTEDLLCVRVAMRHGHPPGWEPPEIMAFADSLLRKGDPLARVTGVGRMGGTAIVEWQSEVPVTTATLAYTCDAREDWSGYQEYKWLQAPAEIGDDGVTARAELPEGARAWFFNLTDQRGLLVSSPHRTAWDR